MKKRLIFLIIVAILTIGADQVTKHWARTALKNAPSINIIPGYLDLDYHENPGSAFGLMRNVPGARYILIGVGILALILVWTMVRKIERHRALVDLAFGLLVGGALGNLLDRIYIGRVVDFILMHYKSKFFWPAYNVADVALVVGVGLLVLMLGRKPEAGRAAPKRKKGR